MERIPESKTLPRQFLVTEKVSDFHGSLLRVEMAPRVHFPVDSCNVRHSSETERIPESKTLPGQFAVDDKVSNLHVSVMRAEVASRIHFPVDVCNSRHSSEMERITEPKMLPREFLEVERIPEPKMLPRQFPEMERIPEPKMLPRQFLEMERIPEPKMLPSQFPEMERIPEPKMLPRQFLEMERIPEPKMLSRQFPEMERIPEPKMLPRQFLEMERIPEPMILPRQFLGAVPRAEVAPAGAQRSQKLDPPVLLQARKGKCSFQEQMEFISGAAAFKTSNACDEGGPSSFSGASHPPEPVDTDLMRTVYVTIDQDKSERGCLMKSLSVKGPFPEDLSVRVPGMKPGTAVLSKTESPVEEPKELEASSSSSPFLVPRALQTTENTALPHDSEEECVWDASLPPSGNISPHSSIDSTGVVTAMSVVNSCTSTYRSDGITSDGMLSMEKNCESAKGSVIGDSLGSGKTSISRASNSSGLSDESNWSNITGSANKPHKGNDPRWKAILAVRARDGILGMSHFRLFKRLGCGDIGSVYLSELSGTRCYFAMKVMDKASLASRKKLTRAQTEREILQLLDHPFLPTLYTHFETDRFSCLVMEFCPGGDLHTLRQRQPGKHFPEYAARFYAAEVLLALEYLHMLGVVYRDLKPENVLVRDDGHIMLSDFDLSLRCAVSPTLIKASLFESDPSKRAAGAFCVQPACIEPSSVCIQPSCFIPRIFPQKSKKKSRKPRAEFGHMVSTLPELVAEPTAARSMSFVGTHEYLAPEIIKGEGHGSAVDWWTFGIFLHELLYGRTPFKGSGNRATLFNVVGQQLRFPDSPATSYSSRDLIRGLLVKEPQHRLGVKRGATEIKQHPFFEGVNWALIRCSTPPEVPRPVEAELPGKSGLAEGAVGTAGVGSTSKRMVGADMKSGGKYLDFEFF